MTRPFTYGSVCSGIEAATVAWHELGWRPAWFAEIEPFPSRVLAHHYPDVPNLGDMTQLVNNKIFIDAIIDLLVGGTPCQSFSLAGLRGGLADLRGNLSLQFCRLLLAKRPPWFVWENVPGVFSSFSGEAADGVPVWETSDFATLLTAFQECGYSVAWRVLDSRHFGVPQRRRRVFVVGHLGDDWRPPAAVLFEPEGLRGHPAPGGPPGQAAAPGAEGGPGGGGGPAVGATLTTSATKQRVDDTYVVMGSTNSKASLTTNEAATLTKISTPILFTGWPAEVANTLNAMYGDKQGIDNQHINSGAPLFVPITINTGHTKANGLGVKQDGTSYTLDQTANQAVFFRSIRRLTPMECERLQGFPDGYTGIPGAADGPRYEAIGNSMTTFVMRWIGRRINFIHNLKT